MEMKHLFRAAALAAMLLTAAACIYPFHPEFEAGGELPLVVEGDIFPGDYTTLTLSHVRPFDDEGQAAGSEPILARGYIEGEDGSRVEGDTRPPSSGPGSPSEGTLYFNTTSIRADQRYRLHFDTLDGQRNVVNTFESDWLTPFAAPTIDGLSYSADNDFDELWIGLTMHCNGAHYFRWFFSEAWEYHSDINTDLEYHPEERYIDRYRGPNLYYCWNGAKSSQINIFSTANQTEDRFEELAFHRIPRDDKRLQVLYRITVRLDALSEDCYNYWNNIRQNSEQQGSLFAPTPSEMASNVHCLTDPDQQVIGYLGAAVHAEATLYYDNEVGKYYHNKYYPWPEIKVSASQRDSMAYYYREGYLPFQEIYEGMSAAPSHYMWTQRICVDCRVEGGSKTRPEDWPSGHL